MRESEIHWLERKGLLLPKERGHVPSWTEGTLLHPNKGSFPISIRGILVICLAWPSVACTLFADQYGPLAEHLHSPQGFAEWTQSEQELSQAADMAADRYRREGSMQTLRAYESAVRNYLDHGFVLFRAYTAANFELPPGLEDSLSRRTDQFMDVADEYLKQRSEVVAVSIARAIIHEYSGPGGMDRAQRRAEGLLMQYRYQRSY